MLSGDWAKSTWSFANSNCAQVRAAGGQVQVRDSKDPGPVLNVTPAAWQAFLDAVKAT
jgi:Domain of unknown function (DUF397)